MNHPPTSAPDTPLSAVQETEAVKPLIVHLPVDARGLALGLLASIAFVFALNWMQALLVPLLLGIFLAYTLNPLVHYLEKIKFPRVLATSIVMLAVVSALTLGAYTLRDQMQTIVTQLPVAANKLSAQLIHMRDDRSGNLQKVQSAVGAMENATKQTDSKNTDRKQDATHVTIDPPSFKLGDFMWASSLGAMGAIGQVVMVIFLVFFILVGGDTFKRKLVRLTGPSFSQKKITVHILDGINASIQKYMLTLVLTNILLGLLTWLTFHLIGLDNAGAWAVGAGFMHVIPYIGPVVTAFATGMAAFMQFDSVSMALLVAGSSLLLATAVGVFVTTWATGRIARMNAAAVFISLLFWGWLWGIWGLLLGIPIIVVVKVVSENVEQLVPVAELLGE
ncbi:MAG: AI-2E family transporter [Sedimenticola thiotaurini]|uniref:AI-2E family transporter n=1 Tax=Sedimenticola thiotaurini TaxID=1543721 RepID=A0A558CWM5_9GAMM|nr:MAG: AI-2E family transporter [Sedimenticola thiotaurini]